MENIKSWTSIYRDLRKSFDAVVLDARMACIKEHPEPCYQCKEPMLKGMCECGREGRWEMPPDLLREKYSQRFPYFYYGK